MSLSRVLFIVALIGLAVHLWNKKEAEISIASETSPNGFISAAMPDGARKNTVIILAPINCPSDATQRADALAAYLGDMGIPNFRSSSYQATRDDPTPEQQAEVERAIAVLDGEVPAVFVNGMAKSNPSADEVVREYERTRHH
jgi:hypothetical protein